MLLSQHLNCKKPITISHSFHSKAPFHRLTTLNNFICITKTPTNLSSNPRIFTSCRAQNRTTFSITSDGDSNTTSLNGEVKETEVKSFWGAVSLIIGTAVGPGMLGLPSATIKSGPLPSTIAIILSWVYVVSSILLVAELTFAAMEEDGVEEVSFTGLAIKALGRPAGTFVSVVYASLNFSLLVACISGIGSLIVQWFPLINPVLAHALFPCIVGTLIGVFSFKATDLVNRLLCILMLFSITTLVAVGLSVGRSKLLGSLFVASWNPLTILPAIPVTVLTLGFHVITPFVCKIVGKTAFEARKAILYGGAVPLVMVLSWNMVVLGLVGNNGAAEDPITLLLSVNSSALPAVQGFAFSALATSLIGYAVSFPKQLSDTLDLIVRGDVAKQVRGSSVDLTTRMPEELATEGSIEGFSDNSGTGTANRVSDSEESQSSHVGSSSVNILVMSLVLGVPVLIASFFRAAFSAALDFAGVYANCFLFGVLPPVMAWIHRSRKKFRSSNSGDVNLLPGGEGALLVLFVVSVILLFWH